MPRENFVTYVEQRDDGCWIWRGRRDARGRPAYSVRRGSRASAVQPRRYAYELFVGAIPEDHWVMPSCGNDDCVSPEHALLLDELGRFMRHVTVGGEDECWGWSGFRSERGYGRVKVRGRRAPINAHRWLWERERGPVPAGLELDHLCNNRACVNPNHLEPVTHGENLRRARERAAA